ncbi:S49 family peptidase [Yoonia sediminilitoris]|uniref:Serine protease SohB n=1 Tax=Yoonia sediminilitoris TaxID=1286148 RepID=A0A2T6KMZ3_9RHOB|nr:S49 family peptidase [Yoonia sediminilitoris]PUB17551.1 serine protease SohB [Yoonia sediminilitoris]RCW97846.1 serine protease SohB [Yoonia sediminilitoris]
MKYIPFTKSSPFVAVIRLQGAITNGGRGLDNPNLAPVIEKAFSKGKPAAVALEINCPGGSPVQSSLIAARIRRLADEKKIPVFAFVEDVAASGGYWLACAADEIFVDDCSITGSIGVISAGFGVPEGIAKLGIERRVHTAGKSKSMMDPFKPEKPADVKRLKGWLEDIHASFIDYVKARRGTKLIDDENLFSGEVYIGQKGIDAGLADGIGHLGPIMKERFGDKVTFRRYGQKRSILSRFGAQIVGDAIGSIEERAAYARFGL